MSESALKTRTVFLDTQAYDDNKLHFVGPSLKKIRELGASGFLKILTTEVVDREVRSHVRRALSSAVTSHERLKGHLAILRALPSGAPSVLASQLDLAQLLPLGLQVWEDFLGGGRVEMVSVEQVGARQLLDLYFEQLPPFSEKKKSEFPDAISLLALEQWQKADGGELYLIGDDPDIKAWCESYPSMHHVPHLKEFVDLYNRAEQQLSGVAVSLFEREEDWIVSVIRDVAGLTQRSLAAKLKRSDSFVWKFEAGERQLKVLEFIELATALDVEPEELLHRVRTRVRR
jgi:hypothetical protein